MKNLLILTTLILGACGAAGTQNTYNTAAAPSPALTQAASPSESCANLLSPITHNKVGPISHWECTANCAMVPFNDFMISYSEITGSETVQIQTGERSGDVLTQVENFSGGSNYSFADDESAGFIDGAPNGRLTFSQSCNELIIDGATFSFVETIGS